MTGPPENLQTEFLKSGAGREYLPFTQQQDQPFTYGSESRWLLGVMQGLSVAQLATLADNYPVPNMQDLRDILLKLCEFSPVLNLASWLVHSQCCQDSVHPDRGSEKFR